jgi:hypothetical protein
VLPAHGEHVQDMPEPAHARRCASGERDTDRGSECAKSVPNTKKAPIRRSGLLSKLLF